MTIVSPHAEQHLHELTRLREFNQIPYMLHKKSLMSIGMELGEQLRRVFRGPSNVYMAAYDAHYFGRGVMSKLNDGLSKDDNNPLNVFWYQTRNMTVGEWVDEEVSWSNHQFHEKPGNTCNTSIVVASTINSFSQNRALIMRAYDESKCNHIVFATPVSTIEAEARLRNEFSSALKITFFTLTSNPKYILDEWQATIGGYKEMTSSIPLIVERILKEG